MPDHLEKQGLPRTHTRFVPFAFAAASALLFAFMNLFAKLATASVSWATVASVRAFIGAGVAYAVARARGSSLQVNAKQLLFWRSFFGTIAMTATFYALSSRTVALGDTVTLFNLSPVFLALLAPIFLRERTQVSVALGIALALAGVVLVVRPSFLFPEDAAMLAVTTAGPSARATVAVAVVGALATSIAMMLLRTAGKKESAEAIAVHFSLFAGVVTAVISLLEPKLPSFHDLLLMLAAGICAGFGQLTMTRAFSMERAAKIGGIGYLAVVVSTILGAIQLGEIPSLLALAGMTLVIAGGIVVTLRAT